MTPQATQILIGSLCAAAAICLLIARMFLRPGRPATAPAPLQVLVLGYRYCPAELRTRAAIQHGDGTATCCDCRTHIPATNGDR